MVHSIITLTTDFGLKDPYVAEMKAVVLRICPTATIVDVSHLVEKFNVKMGAFLLASASPYFPEGSIHVAIVDPGVGTSRRAICIQCKKSIFVGPDNGVLVLAAKAQGIEHVYEVTNEKFMLVKVSKTFHGRDIFAPAAAYLACGSCPRDLGPETRKWLIPEFATVTVMKDKVVGEVIHVDDFGNIVTNVGRKPFESVSVGGLVKIRLGDVLRSLRFCETYDAVAVLEPLVLFGSHDFLEVSVNQGSAAKFFRVEAGDKIEVYPS